MGLYATGMVAPLVRGTIYDEFGNAVYRDVIFMPFFQSESVTLEMGIDHEVKQNCLVAIWHSGQELNSWYEEGMDAEDYETVCIGEGYTMKMTQWPYAIPTECATRRSWTCRCRRSIISNRRRWI